MVFPLMPWKNYTKKDKIQIFLLFFYIFTKKKKPPNLTTREVEQPLMVEREGVSCPASSSFKGSRPTASRRARLSLPE